MKNKEPIEVMVSSRARTRHYKIDDYLIEKIHPTAQEQGIPVQQLINQL